VPDLAEALAMHHAIFVGIEERFDKLMVVSDCPSLIQQLHAS
jgi:hypothetical protein